MILRGSRIALFAQKGTRHVAQVARRARSICLPPLSIVPMCFGHGPRELVNITIHAFEWVARHDTYSLKATQLIREAYQLHDIHASLRLLLVLHPLHGHSLLLLLHGVQTHLTLLLKDLLLLLLRRLLLLLLLLLLLCLLLVLRWLHLTLLRLLRLLRVRRGRLLRQGLRLDLRCRMGARLTL